MESCCKHKNSKLSKEIEYNKLRILIPQLAEKEAVSKVSSAVTLLGLLAFRSLIVV